jgi:hypothetical protein
MSDLRQAIPMIFERFDFEKVQRVMEFLNWTWANEGGVPSIASLKTTARDLLEDCVIDFEGQGRPKSGTSFSTGGFEAYIEYHERGKPRLHLLFYVDTASSTGAY